MTTDDPGYRIVHGGGDAAEMLSLVGREGDARPVMVDQEGGHEICRALMAALHTDFAVAPAPREGRR